MVLYGVLLALFMIMFNMTVTLIGGLNMVSELGGSLDILCYGVSFYCIGNALGIPLGKPAMTCFSQSQLFIFCLLGTVLSSIGCSQSSNFALFILFRGLEGLAAGPLLILITTYYIPKVSGGNSQRAKTLLVICFAVAPLFGASIGGVIGFNYNWRMLFYGSTLINGLLSIYLGYCLPSYNTPTLPWSFDKLEYFFYFVGVLFISSALVTGQQFDWLRSPGITWLLSVGSISMVCFLLRNRCWSQYPIIDFNMLKKPYISLSAVIVALLFSAYFGSVSLIAAWLFFDVNYTPDWIALLMIIMALGMVVRLFFTFHKFDPRFPIAAAVIFFILCCFYSSGFNWDIDFTRIALARLLLGLVIPIFLPPLLQTMRYKLTGQMLVESVSFFHIIRTVSTALGVGLYHILWQRREVFYHLRLGGALTSFSEITQQFLARAKQFNLSDEAAFAQLNAYLDEQSASLALNDCFYAIGWLMIVILLGILITFFFKLRI